MKINHTPILYVIGAVAIALGTGAYVHRPKEILVPTAVTQEVTNIKVSAHDWPSLGEEKEINLGEALNTLGNVMDKADRPKKVTLFCSSMTCANIRKDIDDAFQIAWFDRDFEDRFVGSEGDRGIYVGPPGPDAEALSEAIEATTGYEPVIVPIDGLEGLGVIFGKVEVK